MGLTLISCSGNKLQIRAWEILPVVAQQLLVDLYRSKFIDVHSMGVKRRVLSTAEAFLLVHNVGRLLLLI